MTDPAELRSRYEALAAASLREAGFDILTPDVRAAWTAFKAFAREPLPEASDVRPGFEAYQAADRDRVLWLSFVRSVESADGVGSHLGYVFSCPAPATLVGVHEQSWWWPERSSLEEWFREVESNPVFCACLELDTWTWQGLSD
jgi:hypothetical protein